MRNRIKKIRENLSTAIRFLEENDLSYQIPRKDSKEGKACSEWLSSFPAKSAMRIDWRKVKNSRCHGWKGRNQLAVLLTNIIDELNEESTAAISLMVSWDVWPVLNVSFDVLKKAGTKIIEFDWETWIVYPAKGWCIEITDETICFGSTEPLNNTV